MANGRGRQQQRAQAPIDPTEARLGSRWVGKRPESEEFGEWFKKNVNLHADMDAERYVGGVVLIEQTEKFKVTRAKEDGTAELKEFARLSFTPYAKVDVRVAYFWDLMTLHPEWLGIIEPVPVRVLQQQGYTNVNLPPGFFRHQVEAEGGWVSYIGCAMRARILERDSAIIEQWADKETGEPRQTVLGKPVFDPAPASKLVPVLNWNKADAFSIMKAETGAVGRALGMAGMLVIPGSGIATAEDMQEAQDPGTGSSTAIAPTTSPGALPVVPGAAEAPASAPGEEPPEQPGEPEAAPPEATPPPETEEDAADLSDDALRGQLERDLLELKDNHQKVFADIKVWWKDDRKLGELNQESIHGLQQPMLRGVVRKVSRTLTEAREAAEDAEADGGADS